VPVPFLAFALVAFSLVPQVKAADGPSGTVIRLTVSPATAPKPALRYLLLPELKEMTPGNPIANYLRCLLDQDFSAEQETLGPAALRAADRAARMDKPDWQLLDKMRTDGVGLLLPDVQKFRALAAALQVRFRDEVSRRRFDDALVTAKTMFALSRHLGEHPTLIGGLVGVAIAQLAVAPLEEMLEQPGCPNLYWALTNLPSPLVSFDKGMEGERMFVLAELRDLDEREPMTAEQVKKVVARIDVIRGFEGKQETSTRAWLDKRSRDEKYLAAARARLVEYGIPEDRVARFPADQVTLLDERRDYEVRRDEVMKYVGLPTWEALALLDKAPARRKNEALLGIFLPALERVRRAQGRLEQRVALLRHVEALRLYAAGHEGQWPAKLTDVGVPLPPDPFTGKPFAYKVTGDTASVIGSPPVGAKDDPAFNVRYEVTIRK
jgi:hypothetical protein